MSRLILISTALATLAVFGWAQESKRETKKSTATHNSGYLKIQIVLENEAVFHGLAKKGYLVEKVKRHQYVQIKDSQKSEFGAGVRLWFYDGLPGFLFFHYRDIDKVVVGREITNGELSQLKERKAKTDTGKKTAVAKVAAKKTNGAMGPALDAESRHLLNRWEPHKGWTEEKFADIQKRAITDGYELTDEERAWTRAYPDWLKALKQSKEPVASDKKSPKPPRAVNKAKLVVKKTESKPKTAKIGKSAISADSSGRIKTKIKRPERQKKETSGARRSIR